MNNNYKVIQLTNNNVGAVAADEYMPLGIVTRKISNGRSCPTPFNVTYSGSDTLELTECGYYRITYNASLVAEASGLVTLNLMAGGESVYSVSATATADGTVNLTLPYEVRVFTNCPSTPVNCPLLLQVQLETTGVTGGTSNLIAEKVY